MGRQRVRLGFVELVAKSSSYTNKTGGRDSKRNNPASLASVTVDALSNSLEVLSRHQIRTVSTDL